MRKVGQEERRARLTRRHFLSPDAKARSFVELAGGLVGLHASDPTSVYLAAHARVSDPSVAEIERALYEERTVIRMIGMRRTMFVVPLDLAAIVRAACTNAIAAAQRRRYSKLMEEAGIARDGAAWLDAAGRDTLAALEARGQAFAAELSADVPRLREKLTYGEGKSWAGSQSMTTWVLFLLAAEGRIVRGRPRGAWTGSQWSWVPASSWLDEPLPELDPDAARAELVRRWLRAFGPGTLIDLRWWTGLTAAQIKAGLAAIGAVEVSLDEGTGLVLGDDDQPDSAPEPSAALLPALDPTTMGWKERDWYLGPRGVALFDTNGNAGPTVWWDGRIVGGWMQRKDGEVVHRLLEDVGADGRTAIDAEAERLAAWIGDVRVTPRFSPPFHQELAA
jgi:hypothetical protein